MKLVNSSVKENSALLVLQSGANGASFKELEILPLACLHAYMQSVYCIILYMGVLGEHILQ